MIDGAVPGLLVFTGLIAWSVHLTRLALRRIRSAPGAAPKFQHALPALVAWCWPLVIAAESRAPDMSTTLSWLLPFSAPLAGALLAGRRPPFGRIERGPEWRERGPEQFG
ncbi:MAG TPA: hypothetical protein VIX86_02710 [Streptosporangiaceae bacterium]